MNRKPIAIVLPDHGNGRSAWIRRMKLALRDEWLKAEWFFFGTASGFPVCDECGERAGKLGCFGSFRPCRKRLCAKCVWTAADKTTYCTQHFFD